MNEYPSLWLAVSANWPDIVFAMVISMIGGGVAYFRRLQMYRPRLFSVHEFASYILSSMVAGFIAMMVFAHLTSTGQLAVSPWALAALIPVIGAAAPWILELANKMMIRSANLHLRQMEECSRDDAPR